MKKLGRVNIHIILGRRHLQLISFSIYSCGGFEHADQSVKTGQSRNYLRPCKIASMTTEALISLLVWFTCHLKRNCQIPILHNLLLH